MGPSYWSTKWSITLATNSSLSNFPVTNSRSSHQWGDFAWARSFQAATRSCIPIRMRATTRSMSL